MKYFILSQPKAGTWLCANLLREFGIGFPGLQFDINKYQKYDLTNLEACRRDRKRYTHKGPFFQTISLLNDNQVGLSHFGYSPALENALDGYKKILLVRNYESSVESWKDWAKITGKSNQSKNITIQLRDQIAKWDGRDDVYTLNYNSMRDQDETDLNNLQMFLFDDIKFDSIECIQKAKQADSLTKRKK